MQGKLSTELFLWSQGRWFYSIVILGLKMWLGGMCKYPVTIHSNTCIQFWALPRQQKCFHISIYNTADSIFIICFIFGIIFFFHWPHFFSFFSPSLSINICSYSLKPFFCKDSLRVSPRRKWWFLDCVCLCMWMCIDMYAWEMVLAQCFE